MKKVHIYDSASIDSLPWPESDEGRQARDYLLPLLKEGPQHLITNARTDLYLLTIDAHVIPISVNETEYDNSYLLSSYFVVAGLKERMEQASKALQLCSKPAVTLFGKSLKWMKINKVVIINNWLLSTNLYPDLDEAQIEALTLFLKKRFPDHYLMFRSVNTYKSSTVFDGLNAQNYRMIPTRNVYLYDPNRELGSSERRKQKKDTNKIKNGEYAVESVDLLSDEMASRLLDLYEKVYISKYTKYSPRYTKEYLRQVHTNKTLKIKILTKNNQIYGVTGFLKKNGYLLIPFFGYDTEIPQEEGLYRMLSAVIMQEIEKGKLISHQGSGAADFKKWRGFIEHQEYVAIYDHHLPFSRRLFWTLGEKFSNFFQH